MLLVYRPAVRSKGVKNSCVRIFSQVPDLVGSRTFNGSASSFILFDLKPIFSKVSDYFLVLITEYMLMTYWLFSFI